MQTSTQGIAYHVASGEGESFVLLSELIAFKVKGEGTGACTVFEDAMQPGYEGPPPHIHLNQDESLYVLEGEFTFHIGDRAIPATLGTFVQIPKGTLHTFQNTGTRVGRLLVTLSPPGDFERFVEEVGGPTTEKSPPLAVGPPDPVVIQKIVTAAQKHSIEIPTPAGH
jgi:mannose-6-phosphate isomerase-like protein (cupin superfamily)